MVAGNFGEVNIWPRNVGKRIYGNKGNNYWQIDKFVKFSNNINYTYTQYVQYNA